MPVESESQLLEARTKRILVVDEDACSLLTMMLPKEGFQTQTALDGRDALAKIKQSAPDRSRTSLNS